MKIQLVNTLETECDRFLSTYGEALPRVARRGMTPVLAALTELFRDAFKESKLPPILVFSYRISPDTKTRNDKADPHLVGHVVYIPDRDVLGWKVKPNIMSFMDLIVLAVTPLTDWRDVSLEDLLELGVTPVELVESIKRTAETINFYELASKATQKTALA
jgi:hypothetical protein